MPEQTLEQKLLLSVAACPKTVKENSTLIALTETSFYQTAVYSLTAMLFHNHKVRHNLRISMRLMKERVCTYTCTYAGGKIAVDIDRLSKNCQTKQHSNGLNLN